jgi:hypothetical protein
LLHQEATSGSWCQSRTDFTLTVRIQMLNDAEEWVLTGVYGQNHFPRRAEADVGKHAREMVGLQRFQSNI